jgi:DNA-binding XRE family transcriptional regulator
LQENAKGAEEQACMAGDLDDGLAVHSGVQMRSLRRSAGLTQRGLADKAGVSVGVIRDLEQGKTYRLHPVSAERLRRAGRRRITSKPQGVKGYRHARYGY